MRYPRQQRRILLKLTTAFLAALWVHQWLSMDPRQTGTQIRRQPWSLFSSSAESVPGGEVVGSGTSSGSEDEEYASWGMEMDDDDVETVGMRDLESETETEEETSPVSTRTSETAETMSQTETRPKVQGKAAMEAFWARVRDGRRLFYDGPFVVDHPHPQPTPLQAGIPTTLMDNFLGYHLFSPVEACQLVSQFEEILFLGDSFLRHLVQALTMVMTGNERNGGVRGFMLTPKQQAFCIFERQLDDRNECREAAQAGTDSDPEYATTVCPGTKTRLHFLGHYNPKFLRDNLQELQQYMQDAVQRAQQSGKPVVFVNHLSIHTGEIGYREDIVEQEWVQPIQTLLQPILGKEQQNEWLIPVFHQPHSVGPDKPQEFLDRGQTDADVQRFIGNMRPVLERVGWSQLETYNMTVNATSFDGTHFGVQVNLLKAQLLLNGLHAYLLGDGGMEMESYQE